MSILILNQGSTSFKYTIYDQENILIKEDQTENFLEVIKNNPIKIIISRIVFYPCSQAIIKIDKKVINELEQYNSYAPLHNPQVLKTLKIIAKNYPKITQYICPDSYFHHTISPARSTYALPTTLNKKYQIKKYGFHGLSHQYLALEYQKLSGKKQNKLITCHLGGGTSINATKNNKSLANSMGFSTEEGVMMVKRSGNISANLVLFLQEKLKFNPEEVSKLLTQESGFLGLTGTTDIKSIVKSKEVDCQLAVEIYTNQIVDYIASYHNLLQGVDCVIISGGIGERSESLRKIIQKKLKTLPLEFIVIKTDESRMMLNHYSNLLLKTKKLRN